MIPGTALKWRGFIPLCLNATTQQSVAVVIVVIVSLLSFVSIIGTWSNLSFYGGEMENFFLCCWTNLSATSVCDGDVCWPWGTDVVWWSHTHVSQYVIDGVCVCMLFVGSFKLISISNFSNWPLVNWSHLKIICYVQYTLLDKFRQFTITVRKVVT